MSFTAAEIATHLDGEVIGNQQVVLHGFAPADRAQAGDLTFAENEEYLALAGQSAASAIIAGGKTTLTSKTLIRVKHPRVAFAKALTLFFPEPKLPAGIHPTAVVAPTAQVDATAHVGPHCVLGENVFIGPRVALRGGNHVGDGCRVEADTVLFPNVTLYPKTQLGQRVRIHAGSVIGSDGFGYAQTEGIHLKVPQIGHVIIGDDVEIGACTTVDRGALGPTVIGKGTKIDNLVQIGHNVQVGEYCLIISQAGVAGSSKLGKYVILAGQVGVAGHLEIGDRAILGAQAGVGTNVPAGVTWMGSFAQPAMDFKRQQVGLRELPQLLRRVAELEKLAGIKKGRGKAAAPEA